MSRRFPILLTLVAALATLCSPGVQTLQPQGEDGVARLLRRVEQIAQGGNIEPYLDLLVGGSDLGAARQEVAALILPDATRTIIRERDRAPLEGTLPGHGYRLMLEVLIERGTRARVATWNLDVRRIPTERSDDEWFIESQHQLSTLDGLFRLSLSPKRQYRAHNLVVRSDDLLIHLSDGLLFVAEAPEGPTAAVLLPPNGDAFVFRPAPETEREQVRLYSGSDSIEGRYEEMFLRFNPREFQARFNPSSLTSEPVDPAAFRRAEAVFREEVAKTFSLDLGDLTRETWLVVPRDGEMLAEIRTRRYQTLTYTKSASEIEDIGVFDRKRRRNISLYSSPERLAQAGRSYDEDSLSDYTVTDYDVDATIDPERQSIDGVTRLKIRFRSPGVTTLPLKLADPLKVKSVYSTEFGRLFAFRVRNQNAVVINLPGTVMGGTETTLIVSYSGVLGPSKPEGETTQFPQQAEAEPSPFTGEPSLLYSSKSYWHAQGPDGQYTTARMRITVPAGYAVVGSGTLVPGSPELVEARPGQGRSLRFAFAADQPVRYLACLISRFTKVSSGSIDLREEIRRARDNGQGASDPAWTPRRGTTFIDSLFLSVDANPRQQGRGRQAAATSESVARYYASLVGDCPYPSLSLALIESDTPGGHSPAYVSIINQPLAGTGITWSTDPASFPSYPDFFVAHEVAHQWWGQAVGWRNYHEQWLSEGFAQYFAALYALHSRGEGAFGDLIRKMARWGRDTSAQGPISLGYRLGHIRGDSRVFRALVYNKSAVVLDMLRRIVGDRAFFQSLQRFYIDGRFRRVGTTDLRAAFEREVGRSLDLFFEGWVYSSALPKIRYSWRQEASGAERAAVVTFEQIGRVFELPLTVTLRYADDTSADQVVTLSQPTTEVRVPLKTRLRGLDINRDGRTMAEIEKR